MWFHSFIHSIHARQTGKPSFLPSLSFFPPSSSPDASIRTRTHHIHKKELIKHDDPTPFLPSFPPRSLTHSHSPSSAISSVSRRDGAAARYRPTDRLL